MNELKKLIEELGALLDNFASPAVVLQYNTDLGIFFSTRENIEYKIEELKSTINEKLKNPEPPLKFIDSYLTTQFFKSVKLSSALFNMINEIQQMPNLPCIIHEESLDFSDKNAWSGLNCSTLREWLSRGDIYGAIDDDFKNKLKNFRGYLVKFNKLIEESIKRNELKTLIGTDRNIVQQKLDFSFIKDSRLKAILERDFNEIMCCLASECWKAAIIMCGSSIEAVLYDVLATNNEIIKLYIPVGKKIEELNLWQLIDMAAQAKLVTVGVEKFSHSLRDFRNLIHPLKELKEGYKIDEPEANASFEVLKMVIRDIKQRNNMMKENPDMKNEKRN